MLAAGVPWDAIMDLTGPEAQALAGELAGRSEHMTNETTD